jgi:molybdopterin synthase sulfur carrier subunit
MVNIFYFARLREALGKNSEEIALSADIKNVRQLCLLLQAREGMWREELSKNDIRVALNQEIVDFNAAIKDGDEIAFFPPITGG